MTVSAEKRKKELLKIVKAIYGDKLTWDELISSFPLDDWCACNETLLGTSVRTMLWLEDVL